MEFSIISRLLSTERSRSHSASVLPWTCPIPYFGRFADAQVATIGINPSNKEFEDSQRRELTGDLRRFPTLNSLRLERWDDATGADVRTIAAACTFYFQNNPYRQWFGVLERMMNAGGYSYYRGDLACHLDLVAHTTAEKWGRLPSLHQRELICEGRPVLGQLVRGSDIRVLVLNGRSVVAEFERFAQIELFKRPLPECTLPRASGAGVAGFLYEGGVDAIGGVALGRHVHVVGYNHNLQSSFGVTSEVVRRIGLRVGEALEQATADRAS